MKIKFWILCLKISHLLDALDCNSRRNRVKWKRNPKNVSFGKGDFGPAGAQAPAGGKNRAEENRSLMRIVVIDGQGGKIGRELVSLAAAHCPGAEIWAVGTNSAATAAMMKAAPTRAATGENAVCVPAAGRT
jgi:hypothetical protein